MKRQLNFCRATIFLLVAIVWSLSAHAAAPKVLNIGWTGGSAWTALPDRIAAERGFFEKEGLKVQYIQFQGTNLMLSALLANELDYVTILPFIAGAAIRGLPVKIVGTTTKAIHSSTTESGNVNSGLYWSR